MGLIMSMGMQKDRTVENQINEKAERNEAGDICCRKIPRSEFERLGQQIKKSHRHNCTRTKAENGVHFVMEFKCQETPGERYRERTERNENKCHADTISESVIFRELSILSFLAILLSRMRILHIPSAKRGGAKAPTARNPQRDSLIAQLRQTGDLPLGKSTRGLTFTELLGLKRPAPGSTPSPLPTGALAPA
jgi:hypothetical protein